MNDMTENPIGNRGGAEVFFDRRNITMGFGRILWGSETTDMHGTKHPAGWVLPGGKRTTSSAQAQRVANAIDKIELYARADTFDEMLAQMRRS